METYHKHIKVAITIDTVRALYCSSPVTNSYDKKHLCKQIKSLRRLISDVEMVEVVGESNPSHAPLLNTVVIGTS